MSHDAKEIHKDYINCYQANPFGDETLETGEILMNAISEERRNKWQELIECTNMTHISRKARKTIKILGNGNTITQPRYQVTADQVTYQHVMNCRGNTGLHPNRVKLPKPTKDGQDDSNYTRPFTKSETPTSQ